MSLLTSTHFPGLFNHALDRQAKAISKLDLYLKSGNDEFPFVDSTVFKWDGPIPLSVSRKKAGEKSETSSIEETITDINDSTTSLAALFDTLIPVRFECSLEELYSTAWGQRLIFMSVGQIMSVEGSCVLGFSTLKLRSMAAQYLLATSIMQHPVSLE